MTLLYIANNAIIRLGFLKNSKNEKKLYIFLKDFEEKKGETSFSCNDYIIEIKNGNFVELDLLLMKEENNTIYIDSYEIKSSKKNFKLKNIDQLSKQSLFLLFLVMDGLLIKKEDLCIVDNKNIDNYVVRVKYLNGINENNLKSLNLKEKIDYLDKNSHLFYDIRIKNKGNHYLVNFYGMFSNGTYYEIMEIEKEKIKNYIDILSRNYKNIIKKFLLNNIRDNLNKKESLMNIIKNSISQNSFQDQE